ncbi:MAG: response regulator [Desulfobacterota bacterium]|nr:response regulator [Thermodesulfobacteriota bacterium]
MGEKVHILCVDDEKSILQALARVFLCLPEYQLLTATSGEEGLNLLENQSPIHVVISDYRMPGMNGVDFLKAVREKWPHTVRMVLSGYADAEAVVSAINEGQIYKFIPKPWNVDELKTTLAKAVEWYNLQQQNLRLSEELRRKNRELQEVNENLHRLVQEKTAELLAQNHALQAYQNILDSLPIAVIGLDLNGRVTQCNKKGAERFGKNGKFSSGIHRNHVFPTEVNEMIEKILTDGAFSGCLLEEGFLVRVKGELIKVRSEQEGIVMVFDWEPLKG